MSAVTTLPHSRPLTRADLDQMPDDGHRYEIVDGMLLVSPAPSRAHQRAVGRLYLLLQGAIVGSDLELLLAPFSVVLADDTVVEPDLVLARAAAFTERDLPGPPLLAIEVLSPSTRRYDRFLKHSRYAAAGIPFYWIIDPSEPGLTAYQLGSNGTYEVVGQVSGDEPYETSEPLPVTIVASELVADVQRTG